MKTEFSLQKINYASISNYSTKRKNNKQIFFKGFMVEPLDEAYKIAIKNGLKEKFGLNCKLEDLNAIAGPVELKKLIKKFTPRNFELGDKGNHSLSPELVHKNSLNGTFRINLHTHSKLSDGGSLTPLEFLEMCTSYANKVAKKLGKKDKIPPFTTALTDHDNFSGCFDIIKEIAQYPKKYLNLKYVVGSEFRFIGYKSPYPGFEAVGLGFNPFDKLLNASITKTENPNSLEFIKNVKSANGIYHSLIRYCIKIN